MSLSSHASRWLIAFIAAPILLWVILVAPPLFLPGLVLLVGFAAWREYIIVAFGPEHIVITILAFLGWLAAASGAAFFGLPGLAAGLFLGAAAGFIYFLLNYEKTPSIIDRIARFALGHMYITFFFAVIICLFALDHGRRWVLLALLVTFLSDTSAYYVGRTWGRRPFYPAVSPKKTWEGLGGAVLGAGLTAVVFSFFIPTLLWPQALILGLFLGLWGALGDLFESMLKRAAGVKDSGRLLMGHGGILDRIDALLFNLPLVYFSAVFLTG